MLNVVVRLGGMEDDVIEMRALRASLRCACCGLFSNAVFYNDCDMDIQVLSFFCIKWDVQSIGNLCAGNGACEPSN
jgi:hypothetical protein